MPPFEFKLPDIGEGIHEGEIVSWLVKPGDRVSEDQVIADIQNDKAVVEIPSPVGGVVLEVKAPEGSRVVVGDTLLIFDIAGSSEPGVKEPAGPKPNPIIATPAVRKLAREKGITLAEVAATGKDGRITREDILSFVSGKSGGGVPPTTPSSAEVEIRSALPQEESRVYEERIPFKGIRRVIADAMVKSLYTSPQVTVMDEADATKLVELRERAKPLAERRSFKLTYLPFFIKSLVVACRQFPIMNASLDEQTNEIVLKRHYHVGVAMDTEHGLLVPVIRDADRKSVFAIAEELDGLTARARQGKLASHELKGSTITLSNIGSAGGMFFTPILNFPESAILGTGRIMRKPVARGDILAVAPVVPLSLSFDHRLIDGATAQQFVNSIKLMLEQPELLLLEG